MITVIFLRILYEISKLVATGSLDKEADSKSNWFKSNFPQDLPAMILFISIKSIVSKEERKHNPVLWPNLY